MSKIMGGALKARNEFIVALVAGHHDWSGPEVPYPRGRKESLFKNYSCMKCGLGVLQAPISVPCSGKKPI